MNLFVVCPCRLLVNFQQVGQQLFPTWYVRTIFTGLIIMLPLLSICCSIIAANVFHRLPLASFTAFGVS